MSAGGTGTLNPTVAQSTSLSLSGPTGITWNTFADGDATPDVSAGTYFETANTAPTDIDDFDGATDAKIAVKGGDTNTTIKHDATKIFLKGALDFALAVDDVLHFVERSGVWYEDGQR